MATRREREKSKARRTSAKDWAKKPTMSGNEATSIKLPEGVEFFKLDKQGTIKLDFLPYRVGKWNKRADEGEEHFELEYEAHRIPTPNGTRLYLCRQKVFGKKCACCDWLIKHGANADEKLVQQLRCTTRHLWLVNPEPGAKKPTLRVFDTNHFNKKKGFGEQMAAAINTLDDDEEPFALDGGYTAILTVEEDQFPGVKYNLVTRIDLRPRKYAYPDSILDNAPCLDDCLIDPGYDEVMKLLETGETAEKDDDDDDTPSRNGTSSRKPKPDDDEDADEVVDEDEDGDDEDDEPQPKKKGKHVTAEDLGLEKGMTVTHEEYGECKIVHVSGDGTSLRLKDSDGEIHSAVSPADVSLAEPEDDEDDDEPQPKKKAAGKSTARGKKPADEDEDEPEEDEDDDDGFDDDDGEDDDQESDDDPFPDDDDEDDEPEQKKAPAKRGRPSKK